MQTETNWQQNTQTQRIPNKVIVKEALTKFDQHFSQVKRNNSANKRRDENTYEALITIQTKKIAKYQ